MKIAIEKPINEKKLLKQAKWRVIFFAKNGNSYRGKLLFSTIEKAQNRINYIERWMKKRDALVGIDCIDGIILKQEYRYAMPFPEIGE